MAAIISQIAANKRARQKGLLGGLQHDVSSDKSVYTLPPFDPTFDPLVHNRYMRAMEQKRLLEELGRGDKKQAAVVVENNRESGKERNSKEKTATEIVAGFAILAFGLTLILGLVLYVWLVLKNVDFAGKMSANKNKAS